MLRKISVEKGRNPTAAELGQRVTEVTEKAANAETF